MTQVSTRLIVYRWF